MPGAPVCGGLFLCIVPICLLRLEVVWDRTDPNLAQKVIEIMRERDIDMRKTLPAGPLNFLRGY